MEETMDIAEHLQDSISAALKRGRLQVDHWCEFITTRAISSAKRSPFFFKLTVLCVVNE